MRTIFSAEKQLIKFSFIIFLSLVFAAAMIWIGIGAFQSYGLLPSEGGVLAPFSIRLAWLIGSSVLGLSCPVGIWVYAECYVSRIEFDDRTRTLNVYTLRPFGSKKHEINVSRIVRSEYNDGRSPFDSSIKAPYWVTRVKGRKLPLLIDGQGEFIEEDLTHQLLRL
jgi:hypothetical protein